MSYMIVMLVLGMLILIHELGHFAAARWAGIPVERFSMGFGPALWRTRRGGTEYCLGAIPFGGYVLPAIQEEHDWLRIPMWRRIAFALGGPLANLLVVLPLFAVANIIHGDVSLYSVFIAPFVQTATLIAQFVVALMNIGQTAEGLSGPLGIVVMGGAFVGLSLARAVMFTILMSVNLAVFNLLPMPPLDGGKILLDVLQRFVPKASKLYVPAAICGWLLIAGLFIYTTACDVARMA